MQGPEVVTLWVKKYGVTFLVAVDTADVFGAAFGLKAIPASFLVDEVGIVRLQGGGPSKEFRAQVEEILREPVSSVRGPARESPSALSLDELRVRAARKPDDAAARLALALALERSGDMAGALAECAAAARVRNRGIETFHDFKGPRPGPFRIDWILTRGPWEARDAEVFTFSRGGQFPSDHHPVRARLKLF